MIDKGEEIDLNASEEAALDSVWDTIGAGLQDRLMSGPGDLVITKQVPKEQDNGGSTQDSQDR